MQYLLKVELESAPAWRLVALDGTYTLSQAAELIAIAFGYGPGQRSFTTAAGRLDAGLTGSAQKPTELKSFDELGLGEGAEFAYSPCSAGFAHKVRVMRCEEHLYCLMPSCLVGSGLIPSELAADEAGLAQYLDSEEAQSLDLRECNYRIREFAKTLSIKPQLSVPFASC